MASYLLYVLGSVVLACCLPALVYTDGEPLCTCDPNPFPLEQQLCLSDYVVKAKIRKIKTKTASTGEEIKNYKIKPKMFKPFAKLEKKEVMGKSIESYQSADGCGVDDLKKKGVYLVTGMLSPYNGTNAKKIGKKVQRADRCGLIKPWDELSTYEQTFVTNMNEDTCSQYVNSTDRCPTVDFANNQNCSYNCGDNGCPDGTICCSNGCGYYCTKPTDPHCLKFLMEGFAVKLPLGFCHDQCFNGCLQDWRCCSYGCIKLCVYPFEELPTAIESLANELGITLSSAQGFGP